MSCLHRSHQKIRAQLRYVFISSPTTFARQLSQKKKKKEKSGGAKNIFAPPQKKKKSFFGAKNFLRGDFRLQQGFSGFSSAPQRTQPSTTRWLSHSQCVKVVPGMLPAIVATFSSSRKASEVITWKCISFYAWVLSVIFRSLRSRKYTLIFFSARFARGKTPQCEVKNGRGKIFLSLPRFHKNPKKNSVRPWFPHFPVNFHTSSNFVREERARSARDDRLCGEKARNGLF